MGNYVNLTASALVKTGPGQLLGIFVASASNTPTIKVWAQTSAATPVLINTFTPVAGTMYNFAPGGDVPGIEFVAGLYVTIGGTVDCTVIFE